MQGTRLGGCLRTGDVPGTGNNPLPLPPSRLLARPAWAHPEDVVALVEELPGLTLATRLQAVRVAWLHDIIEDGKKEDGSPVTADDLRRETADDGVLEAVIELSHHRRETREDYLARVTYNCDDPDILLVKVCDRVCNMREAALSFKDERWARYVDECSTYFLPSLRLLRRSLPLTHDFLRTELCRAIGVRPVVRPK